MSPASLKVGYVLKRFPRLSETFVLNEMLALERRGVEIEVFSLKRPLDEPHHLALSELRAKVTYVGGNAGTVELLASTEPAAAARLALLMPGKTESQRTALANKARSIAHLAHKAGIHHLHAHFASDAASAAMLAAVDSGLPFSFTAHARDIYHCYVSQETDDAARWAKIAAARFVTTVSDFNLNHLRKLAGPRHAGKIVRLYNGVNLGHFAPGPPDLRKAGAILTVGRLVEKKGLADLIEACRLLAAKRIDFTCDIVGDGPLRSSLDAQIAEAGLQRLVHLRGARTHEEVRALMQRASLFVLPSLTTSSGDRDGLPTVLLEALGAGLPAISTRVAGIPEILEHERSGLLVEPSDPRQLAEAISRLIVDPTLAGRFADAGLARAHERFDLDVNAATLHQLLALAADRYPQNHERNGHAHSVSLG